MGLMYLCYQGECTFPDLSHVLNSNKVISCSCGCKIVSVIHQSPVTMSHLCYNIKEPGGDGGLLLAAH